MSARLSLLLLFTLATRLNAQEYAWERITGPQGCQPFMLQSTNSGALLLGTMAGIFRTPHPDSAWTLVNSKGWYTTRGNDGVLYSYGYHYSGGLYRSYDDGLTWQIYQQFGGNLNLQVYDSNRMIAGNGDYVSIVVDRESRYVSSALYGLTNFVISFTQTGKIVVAGSPSSYDSTIGIFRSTDDGKTWDTISASFGEGATYSLLQEGNSMLLSTGDGLFRSLDEGLTWFPVNLNGQFRKLTSQCGKLLAAIGQWEQKWVTSSDGGVNWDTVPQHAGAGRYHSACDRLYSFNSDGVRNYDADSNLWRLRNEGIRGFVPSTIQIDSNGAIWLGHAPQWEVPIWYVGSRFSDWWQPIKELPGLKSVVSARYGSMFGLSDHIHAYYGGDNWKESYRQVNSAKQLRFFYGTLYAVYNDAVGMSADNGYGWTTLPGRGYQSYLKDICVLPNGDMYYLHQNGVVATSNGTDWRTIGQQSISDNATITYDPVRGHLYVRDYRLMQTTNDGATWLYDPPFGKGVTHDPIIAPDGRIFLMSTSGNLTSTDGVHFELVTDTVLGKGIVSFHGEDIYVARGHELFRAVYSKKLSATELQVKSEPWTIVEGRLELATPQEVIVRVYDITGRFVETLYDGLVASGLHSLLPTNVSSGIYIVTVDSGERSQSLKVLVR